MSTQTAAVARERLHPAARRSILGGVITLFIDSYDIYLPALVLPAALGYFEPGNMSDTTKATLNTLVFTVPLLGRPIRRAHLRQPFGPDRPQARGPHLRQRLPYVRSMELFRDRWVCVCWDGNRALNGSAPTLADLSRLSWVAPFVPDRGRTSSAPLFAQLAILGIQPHVAVRVESYQAVPYFLPGTNHVALLQERLASKLAGPLNLRIVEIPGASQAIVEALWWCEHYDDDPAHRWLRHVLQVLAAEVWDPWL